MKLAISVALSHHSKLLILDEATSGLDPVIRDDILDMLLDFVQDEEHSILVSSHITSDLEKIADNVLTYNTGYGSAVKNYNEFQTMIVVEGKNVSRVSKTELPRYFGHGKNAFVLFKAGRAVGIVLKGNER